MGKVWTAREGTQAWRCAEISAHFFPDILYGLCDDGASIISEEPHGSTLQEARFGPASDGRVFPHFGQLIGSLAGAGDRGATALVDDVTQGVSQLSVFPLGGERRQQALCRVAGIGLSGDAL